MMLATAYLFAPWVGIDVAAPEVAHRVDRDGIPVADWETAERADAACGARVQLVEVTWKALRTRGTKIKRCKACRETKP